MQMMEATIDEMLPGIAKTYRAKGKALLEHIHDHPDMSWNERYEFIYKGTTIKGSMIVDLVNDALRPRRNFHAREWKVFAKALKESNVNQNLIRNPRFMKRDLRSKQAACQKTEFFITLLQEEREKVRQLTNENNQFKELLKRYEIVEMK